MRKISVSLCFSVLIFCVLTLSLCEGAAAQTPPAACKIFRTIGIGCGFGCDLPPTAVCDNPCEFFCGCYIKTVACPPASAPQDTSCGSCQKVVVGEPINLMTGNTYITQADISLPGLGGGLSLLRTWNSILPPSLSSGTALMFGPRWRSTYEEKVFVGTDGYFKYARTDGSVWSFGWVSGGASLVVYGVAAPANETATLTSGATNWTMVFKSGEQRLFDNTTGALTAIIDRNGNTTQLTYDAGNRLTTVTDAAGRHLNFSYLTPAGPLVSGVSSDAGISLSYAYDASGRLSQVTRPDSTTITFQYDLNSNITAVLDANNKVLESHTYDAASRGLTSSRANGVESLTVTYPQ